MLEFDLHNVVAGRSVADNFTAQLIRLFFKADMRHFGMLKGAFPNCAKVVEEYKRTGEILKGILYD